jgi:hypothetical protein
MTHTNTGSAQKTGGAFAVKFLGLALVLAAAFLFPAAPLAAQETTGNYFVRQSETGEQAIVQRLAWPVDENVSRYEVVVESGGPDAFAEIHRESTEGGFIDISLGPGKYRYQVLVYNLLNQFEYATNWASFNIILAIQPEITSHTPDIMYIYEDYRWELQITGQNLVEDAEVFIVPLEGPENPAVGPIAVKNYTPSGETALLVFERADLLPGIYRILVRNPGGLEASSGPVYIDAFRAYDLEFSVGYAPLLPMYGYLFDTFNGAFYPLGGDLRGSFVFFKRPWGFLGAEASLFLDYLSGDSKTAKASAFITGGTASLLYRKLLPLRGFVFNARLGGGISAAPFHLVFEYKDQKSEPLTNLVPHASLGVSLEWRFFASLYAELGADYVHVLSRDTPQPGFLRPFFNLGWRYLPTRRELR